MENAPALYSTDGWENFFGKLDFVEIAGNAAYSKHQEEISAEHLIKVYRIDLKSSQNTLNATTKRGVSTENPKLTRNFGTGDRMLRYKCIKFFSFMDTFFVTNKYGKP